jgi:propionyl-CoA carboxylase alpha chain
MEARVYAEDPHRGFLPSPNILTRYQEPALPGVRIDTAMVEGEVITMNYDPMISKLIATETDRTKCINLLGDAIDKYVIRGPADNLTFCRDLLEKEKFVDGSYDTGFLEVEYPGGTFVPKAIGNEASLLLAGVAHALHVQENSVAGTTTPFPKFVRLNNEFFGILTDEKTGATSIAKIDESGKVLGKVLPFDFDNVELRQDTPLISVRVGSDDFTLQYLDKTHQGYKIRFQGSEVNMALVSSFGLDAVKHEMPPKDASMATEVISPMTGRVKEVLIRVGDTVSLGQ